MFDLGLKLWTTNKNYIKEACKLYEQGFYNYIELFVVPGTYSDFIGVWRDVQIPYVIHGPHFMAGLDFSKSEFLNQNMKMVKETQCFADDLGADIIIFHSGMSGNINQVVFQLKKVKDGRIVVENKPYFSLDGKMICNGKSPQEIDMILTKTKVGFCLDIAHAICAANAYKIDQIGFIRRFLKLKPKIFHLSDNDFLSIYDEHRHFGKGSYCFTEILKLIPDRSMITIETKKNFDNSLEDFKQDVLFINNIS